MNDSFPRHLNFEQIINFRDIGGYRTRDGRTVVWRRLFRSGEFHRMTMNDLERLTGEIGVTSVVDLRSEKEATGHGTGLLSQADVKYHNVPFMTGGGNREEDERMFREITNMGEFYLYLVRRQGFGKRIIEALEIIADPANHPLVFHCAVGKDRTGILAAVLLSVLGIADDDIIEDYILSEPYMDELLTQADDNPKLAEAIEHLPGFFWKAAPESMELFLSTLKQEYSSIKDYLYAQGAEPSLPRRLEKALLL
jgi:protein-tyrosine phosphatase